MGHRASTIAALLVVGSATARLASADQAQPLLPRHRVVYENLLALRVNPIGVEDQAYLGYRIRLHDDPAPLWRDGYVGVAFTPTLNPAVLRPGGTVELRPLSILLFSAGTYLVSYLGSQGHLQSFADADAPHSDTDIEAGEKAGRNYAVSGLEVQLRAQLIGKIGPVVLRTDSNFYGSELDLAGDDRFSYTPRLDVLQRNGGWVMTNDTDLVYLASFGLVAGVRNTVAHAFYADNPNTPTDRLGPLLAFVFFDHPGAAFNKPTALLLANWWLAHRYRTGADVSRALPYLIAGFRFEGELWSSR